MEAGKDNINGEFVAPDRKPLESVATDQGAGWM